jgi:hypothetical protein
LLRFSEGNQFKTLIVEPAFLAGKCDFMPHAGLRRTRFWATPARGKFRKGLQAVGSLVPLLDWSLSSVAAGTSPRSAAKSQILIRKRALDHSLTFNRLQPAFNGGPQFVSHSRS